MYHCFPTTTIILVFLGFLFTDTYDLIASKQSYHNGIREVQSWCKSKGTLIDLSHYFGSGAKVHTTLGDGTFDLTLEYKGHGRMCTLEVGRSIRLKYLRKERYNRAFHSRFQMHCYENGI